MSNPKRHHFVPKAYLMGFTEPDSQFLNVYSRRSGLWRRQRPDHVMVRNKYYRQDWAPDGVDPNILEKRLGHRVEPDGLAALRKLAESPESLTDFDSANIVNYLELQRIRVPRQADMVKELLKTHLTSHLLGTSQGRAVIRAGEITIKDSFRLEFMRLVAGRMLPYITRMTWEIFRAADDLNFITSDSPVTFLNKDFPSPTEPGVALFGTVIIFPINSSIC